MKKSYLDSSILIPIPVGPEKNPDQFRVAVGVLDKIKSGETVGIVSPLALMEVMTVLRVKKGREKHLLDTLPPAEQSEFILRESKSMYDGLVTELMKMSNLKFEQGGKHIDANIVMSNALDILSEVKGRVLHTGDSWFKGPSPADVIHALLAKGAGCDELVTSDRGFEEMSGFDEFADLKFRVLKW